MQTRLSRLTEATLGSPPGECVMDDCAPELRRHLPIWLAARGRVLVTGLGLGCVVRGLLASPAVAQVEVVEIDSNVIELVWPEFEAEPRVALRQGDALSLDWPSDHTWDYAWHDIWADPDDETTADLDRLHQALLLRYRDRCPRQGAWQLPRLVKRSRSFRDGLIG